MHQLSEKYFKLHKVRGLFHLFLKMKNHSILPQNAARAPPKEEPSSLSLYSVPAAFGVVGQTPRRELQLTWSPTASMHTGRVHACRNQKRQCNTLSWCQGRPWAARKGSWSSSGLADIVPAIEFLEVFQMRFFHYHQEPQSKEEPPAMAAAWLL